MRLYPHLQDTGGFFVALLEKVGNPDDEGMAAGMIRAMDHLDAHRPDGESLTNAIKRELSPEADAEGAQPAAKKLKDDDGSGVSTPVDVSTANATEAVSGDSVKEDKHAADRARKAAQQKAVADGHGVPGGLPYKEDPFAYIPPSNDQGRRPRRHARVQVEDHLGRSPVHPPAHRGARRAQGAAQGPRLPDRRPLPHPRQRAWRVRRAAQEQKMGSYVIDVLPSEHEGRKLDYKLSFPIWRAVNSVNLMLDKQEKSALSFRIFDTDLSSADGGRQFSSQPSKKATKAAKDAEMQQSDAEDAARAALASANASTAPAVKVELAAYQSEYIQLALDSAILKFDGPYTLKSGRLSPYFFNAGLFNTGAKVAKVAECYAKRIVESGVKFDVLFGPAYKGIPLAAATAMALQLNHGIDVGFCFKQEGSQDAWGGRRRVDFAKASGIASFYRCARLTLRSLGFGCWWRWRLLVVLLGILLETDDAVEHNRAAGRLVSEQAQIAAETVECKVGGAHALEANELFAHELLGGARGGAGTGLLDLGRLRLALRLGGVRLGLVGALGRLDARLLDAALGHVPEAHLDHGATHNLERIRIDVLQEVVLGCRVVRGEELEEDARLVHLDRAVGRRVLGNPLDVRLGLGRARVAVRCNHLDGLALVVGLERRGGDGEGHLEQTHGLARREAEVVLAVLGAEVRGVDVDGAREGHLVGAHLGRLGMQRLLELLVVVLGQILDGHLERVEHHHEAWRRELEVLTNRLIEAADLDGGLGGGDAERADEREDGAWRHTAAAEGDEREHARVVPVLDVALLDELEDLALGHDGALERQTAVLGLARLVHLECVAEPLVRLAREDEFGGAERVADVFEAIDKTVGKVVGRVDAPVLARAVMRGLEHTVGDEVPHLRIAILNVLLHAERDLAGRVFAVLHVFKILERLLDGTVAEARGLAGAALGTATLLLDLFWRRVVDVGLSALDELDGELVEPLEVVARVGDLEGFEAEPTDGFEDAGKVLFLLGFGVGVVVAEVAEAAVVTGKAKVDGDGLAVTDVEESVGFWWESRHDHALCGCEVLLFEFGLDLRILAGLVEVGEEALLEHGVWVDGAGGCRLPFGIGCRCCGGLLLFLWWCGLLGTVCCQEHCVYGALDVDGARPAHFRCGLDACQDGTELWPPFDRVELGSVRCDVCFHRGATLVWGHDDACCRNAEMRCTKSVSIELRLDKMNADIEQQRYVELVGGIELVGGGEAGVEDARDDIVSAGLVGGVLARGCGDDERRGLWIDRLGGELVVCDDAFEGGGVFWICEGLDGSVSAQVEGFEELEKPRILWVVDVDLWRHGWRGCGEGEGVRLIGWLELDGSPIACVRVCIWLCAEIWFLETFLVLIAITLLPWSSPGGQPTFRSTHDVACLSDAVGGPAFGAERGRKGLQMADVHAIAHRVSDSLSVNGTHVRGQT
ncbi:hypothetical protein L1887_62128 [Cichorium endivia]|nr:hypothetical protein L1887_62128 [Cichorium endivia]